MEEMYAPTAFVFGPYERQSQSARLMLARRLRKFSNQLSSMSVELGTIDLQMAGEVCVASYPYQLNLFTTSDAGRVHLHCPYSRATQVFQRDSSGSWRILHEHLSLGEPGKKTVIPPGTLSATNGKPAADAKPPGTQAPLRVLDTLAASGMKPVSNEEVKRAIHQAWDALERKSKEQLESSFLPTAIFFATDARRSEPARLAITRRTREFFNAGSSARGDLGSIDVQVVGSSLAIAWHPFQFHIVKQLTNGKRIKTETPLCRASVVLVRDEDGALRILHEHQSAVSVGHSEEIGAARPATGEPSSAGMTR